MKIRNEQLESLLPQEFVPKTAPTAGQEFENMLAGQLNQEAGGVGAPNLSPAALGGLGFPLTPPALADPAEPDDGELLSGLVSQADDLLSAWDQYAETLGSGTGSAKSAWAMLTGMDAGVRSLRETMGRLGTRGQELGAVVNELEVLTATEKFKINRGDYQ